MICEYCSAKNKADALECRCCGAPLPDEKPTSDAHPGWYKLSKWDANPTSYPVCSTGYDNTMTWSE